MTQRKSSGLRWFWRVSGSLLSILLLGFMYLILIISQPQEGESPKVPEQPLLTASPARTPSTEADLVSMISSFPVPVMSFMSGSGMVFVSASSGDVAWQDGFGRILTLYWQTPEGEPLILQSIYPAAALDLIGKGDYSFSKITGPAFFGQPSVCMENKETLRLHTVTDTGIHVMTVPRTLSASLSALSRSIQLFTIE